MVRRAFVQRSLVALDIHQHIMGLVQLLDRIRQLTPTPVFQAMNLAAMASNVGLITFDHGRHLLALIGVNDKHNFVMTHGCSFWLKPPAMRMRWSKANVDDIQKSGY